jgi:hypothetical protein
MKIRSSLASCSIAFYRALIIETYVCLFYKAPYRYHKSQPLIVATSQINPL